MAVIGKEEAIISMNHALEMSETWKETVKILKRQMMEQREQAKEQNFLVY